MLTHARSRQNRVACRGSAMPVKPVRKESTEALSQSVMSALVDALVVMTLARTCEVGDNVVPLRLGQGA